MKIPAISLLVFALLCTMDAYNANANSCVVADPTGTPLNVRSSPQGTIVSTLSNGVKVNVVEHTQDNSGKSWVKLTDPNGYVLQSYLNCNKKSQNTSRQFEGNYQDAMDRHCAGVSIGSCAAKNKQLRQVCVGMSFEHQMTCYDITSHDFQQCLGFAQTNSWDPRLRQCRHTDG